MEDVLAKLLTDVKSGDADAFERLSMRYAPLIDSLLRRYLNDRRFDIEDFRQEAEIALYSAACAYNCRQNKVTFGLFAGTCIKNRIISILRREKRIFRESAINPGGEGDGFIFVSDMLCSDYHEDPASIAVTSEMYRSTIAEISVRLTDYERSVFKLYLSGLGADEIAKKTGRERKSVENAICRIRSKIRKLYNEKSHGAD